MGTAVASKWRGLDLETYVPQHVAWTDDTTINKRARQPFQQAPTIQIMHLSLAMGRGQLTGKSLDWAIIVNCCCAFVLFGYDQGVLSGLVSTPEFLDTFSNPSAGLLGTIVAIYDIGCVVGSLATIVIGDVLGRRRSMYLGGVLV